MNRTFAALFAVGLLFLVVVGVHSGAASAAEDEAATTELDDGLLRWLLRSRWWRQTPEQPALPALSDMTHDSLRVTWTTPESAAFEIVDFDVQYRAAGADFVDWVHDGTARQAMITGLTEITEYGVRVRAESEAGEGDWSAVVIGMTLVAPPTFVEGESADRGVEENTLTGEAIGDPVTATVSSGALRYSLGGADAGAFAIDVSSGQLRTRDGVDYDYEARSSYAVEVVASVARAGTGRIAVRIAVLDVEEPPGKPVALAVSALGSTGLQVTWDAPENTGPAISGYDVEYRARDTEDYLDAGHEGTETRATITGLARQTLYEVRARAVNDEGAGAWSDTSQGRTPGSGGGGGGQPPPPPPPGFPDLVVQSVSVSDSDVDGGESFTLRATVRNRGDVAAAATTLRYYRSSNATISTSGTQVGSDSVGDLAADSDSDESIALTAPANAGTYYYGACADSVAGESDTGNNCSSGAELTVKAPGPKLSPADQRAFDALFLGNFLSTRTYVIEFLSGGRFRESDQDPGGYTYTSTGRNTGTVTQTYDDTNRFGGSCTIQLTFVAATAGTLSYTCASGHSNTEDWRLNAIDSSSFNIDVVWVGARPASVDSAVRAAIARWESVIATNIGAAFISGFSTADDFFGVVDDVRVYVQVATIDGPGGTAGSGGARIVRVSSKLPVISAITLDRDDISRLSAADLRDIALHEMAHALGFATVWDNLGLVSGPDTHFNGAKAIAAFDAAGGSGYAGEKVPADSDEAHWRGSVFGANELMIGSFIGGSSQRPMSAITVQSMADIGYTVNVSQADAYTLPSTNSPTMRALASGETRKDWIPLKCIVTRPVPTDEVTVIELRSSGLP